MYVKWANTRKRDISLFRKELKDILDLIGKLKKTIDENRSRIDLNG